MTRKDEAAQHLLSGKSPREIARTMGITIASVEQYLYTKVGEGTIKRSDILFSIERETRRVIEDIIQQSGKTDFNSIFAVARRMGHALNYDELRIYLKLRDARVSMGDMYELICRIELNYTRRSNSFLSKRTVAVKKAGGDKESRLKFVRTAMKCVRPIRSPPLNRFAILPLFICRR